MKKVERQAIVQFSADKMFQLVNDIEAYPQFMQGCKQAKILERGEDWLIANLELVKAGFQQSFTTRNKLKPPHSMTMELVDGPFKIFKGTWTFKAFSDESCEVKFHLEYEFANFLLGMAAGSMMNQLANEQVEAICQRAKQIYK